MFGEPKEPRSSCCGGEKSFMDGMTLDLSSERLRACRRPQNFKNNMQKKREKSYSYLTSYALNGNNQEIDLESRQEIMILTGVLEEGYNE